MLRANLSRDCSRYHQDEKCPAPLRDRMRELIVGEYPNHSLGDMVTREHSMEDHFRGIRVHASAGDHPYVTLASHLHQILICDIDVYQILPRWFVAYVENFTLSRPVFFIETRYQGVYKFGEATAALTLNGSDNGIESYRLFIKSKKLDDLCNLFRQIIKGEILPSEPLEKSLLPTKK